MEIEDIVDNAHPRAKWGIWSPSDMQHRHNAGEVQNFIESASTGYVGSVGGWVIFEHYDDALLWRLGQ